MNSPAVTKITLQTACNAIASTGVPNLLLVRPRAGMKAPSRAMANDTRGPAIVMALTLPNSATINAGVYVAPIPNKRLRRHVPNIDCAAHSLRRNGEEERAYSKSAYRPNHYSWCR